MYDEDGRLYDILVGTFLVVGLTENDFEVKSILSHALIEVIVLRYISAKKSNPKGENLGFNQFALSKSNSFSTIITSMNCILLQKLTYFIIYQFVLNFK